jgi:hypothetical protein
MKRALSMVLGLTLLASVQAASAGEARPAVAPPGRCAEPWKAADLRGGGDFSVVGPVSALFDPRDVAAGPVGGAPLVAQAPPSGRAIARPGSCDQPGSGCGLASGARGTVTVPPVEPGTRPTP